MKKCCRCKEYKNISEFHKHTHNCKKCVRDYYLSRQEEIKENRRKYYTENREKCNKIKAEFKEKNKHKELAYREKIHGYLIQQSRNYYKNNTEKVKETMRKSYLKHKEKRLKYCRERRLIKIQTDTLFKLKESLRSRIKGFFYKKDTIKKQTPTLNLLGGNFEIAKKYIERQFKKGMSWDNHGLHTWHIDHKIPLSSAKTEEELLKLFHYTNLQPMWCKENLKKGRKITEVQIILTI